MREKVSLNSIVAMRKPHACGANEWKVVRTGADVMLRCLHCGRTVMMDYAAFLKKLKKVVTNEQHEQ